jgi:hypothetical protein
MKRFKTSKEQEKYNLMKTTSNEYSSSNDDYSSDENDYSEIRKGILSNSQQDEEYYEIPNGIKGGDYFSVFNNNNQLCWVKCPYFKDEGDRVYSFETEVIIKNSNNSNNNNEKNLNIFSFNFNNMDSLIYYGKPTNWIVFIWIMMEFILFMSLIVALSIQTWSIMSISNECPNSYPDNKNQDIYFQLFGGMGNSQGCGNNGALYNNDDNMTDNYCIKYSTNPSSTSYIFWQTVDKITSSDMSINDINYYLPLLQYILPAAIFLSLLSCLIHTFLFISKNTTKRTSKFLSLLGMFILFLCGLSLVISIILSNAIDVFNSSYWTKLYSDGYDINYLLDYSNSIYNSDINTINLKSPENYNNCYVELIDEPSKIALLWSFIWCLISLFIIIFNGCFGHPFFASCIDDSDYLKDYLDSNQL